MRKNLLKKTILTGALALAAISVTNAQDIHFSQFYETSILRNPALTGIFTGDYKVGAIYRSQWNSISSPFQTALVTAETRIPVSDEVNDFVSIGLLGSYDKAGSINMQTLSVCPSVNYNKSLEDQHNSFLSAGFMGGYVQRSFDPGRMTFDEQYQNGTFEPDANNGETLPNPKITQWDLGAGVSFSSSAGENNSTTYYLGVSAYHLTRPRDAFFNDQAHIRQQARWNVSAGLGLHLDDTWRLQFHGNYTLQGPYNEIIAGGLLGWTSPDAQNQSTPLLSVSAGVFYRMNDAIIPTFKLEYKDLSFGASYDLNTSSLKAATNLRGGFEISMFKTGLFKDPRFEKSRTVCPKFW